MSTPTLHAVTWTGGLDDGVLLLVDQSRLPGAVEQVEVRDLEGARAAIANLVVRGPGATGIAAAYALIAHLVPEAHKAGPGANSSVLAGAVAQAVGHLGSSRTAVASLNANLARLRACFERHSGHLTALEMCARLLMEAKRIHREDAELCNRIAHYGAALLPDRGGIYTHSHTGALSSGGVGTALGSILLAHAQGKGISVYVGESRPTLTGARLAAPELHQAGVPATLVCDQSAAGLMVRGLVQAVIIGAERIAANGDLASPVGSYALAVLARHHGIPFYVAAPTTVIDPAQPDGSGFIVEERPADEVRLPASLPDMPCLNPSSDIIPAHLVTAVVSERGVVHRPCPSSIARLLAARE